MWLELRHGIYRNKAKFFHDPTDFSPGYNQVSLLSFKLDFSSTLGVPTVGENLLNGFNKFVFRRLFLGFVVYVLLGSCRTLHMADSEYWCALLRIIFTFVLVVAQLALPYRSP